MAKICYVEKVFNPLHQDIIDKANVIIDAYAADGYDLTLRQLYYQFVSRDWFPESWQDPATGSTNNDKSYDKLGDIISMARRAGLIDWDAIVDRTRNLRDVTTWENPAAIVDACGKQFKVDRWDSQQYRPEVWVEKDALIGVIEVACRDWRVPYFSCRGYVSDSEAHAAAQRLLVHADRGQIPLIFHLGDHDPSGIDMTRDVRERINLFAGEAAEQIEVRRIALTMDQVNEVNPPHNPAKVTDARFRKYREQYGLRCWELDALTPQYITDLIATQMEGIVDSDSWEAEIERENNYRRELADVSRRWTAAVTGARR